MLTNQHDENTYECDNCGNVWDGNAQCVCGMNYDDSDVSDNDSGYAGSDASDMLDDFEDSGHIPTHTTRGDIKKMLAVARSQEETDEVPEWMDETRDYLTRGVFIDGKYYIACVVSAELASPPFKQMVLAIYPMLTDEECDQFSAQSKAGVDVCDIVDGFNIKRMRDYDNARVFGVNWPQWADGEQPTLELVKMKCE